MDTLRGLLVADDEERRAIERRDARRRPAATRRRRGQPPDRTRPRRVGSARSRSAPRRRAGCRGRSARRAPWVGPTHPPVAARHARSDRSTAHGRRNRADPDSGRRNHRRADVPRRGDDDLPLLRRDARGRRRARRPVRRSPSRPTTARSNSRSHSTGASVDAGTLGQLDRARRCTGRVSGRSLRTASPGACLSPHEPPSARYRMTAFTRLWIEVSQPSPSLRKIE